MSKVDHYLSGYYGMKNTGDDALMAVTSWGVGHFLCSKNKYFSNYSDIHEGGFFYPSRMADGQRFKGQNRLINYLSALRAKNIVFGGGSVFHSYKDIQQKNHMMRLSGNGCHLALGVSLGPFENTKTERECSELLKRCSFVGVRDRESLEIARAISPDANVRLTFDLALSMLSMVDTKLPLTRSGIGISLCPLERLNGNSSSESRRIESLARELVTVLRDTSETLYFIDFNGHQDFGDTVVHKELVERIIEFGKFCRNIRERLVHISYQEDPFNVLKLISSFRCLLSMRLHGCVFGYMTQTPVLSLGYHKKCLGWKNQIDMPDEYYFDLTENCLDDLGETLMTVLDGKINLPGMDVTSAHNASLNNWRYAYEFHYQKKSNHHYQLERRYSAVQ